MEDRTLRLDLLVCDLMRRYAQSGASFGFSCWYAVFGKLAEAVVSRYLSPIEPPGFEPAGKKVQNKRRRRK